MNDIRIADGEEIDLTTPLGKLKYEKHLVKRLIAVSKEIAGREPGWMSAGAEHLGLGDRAAMLKRLEDVTRRIAAASEKCGADE